MDVLFRIKYSVEKLYPGILHTKGDDTKLKYNQFKQMSLKCFEGLYFWIYCFFFFFCYYCLLLLWFCGIFLVLNTLIPLAVLWKTLANKMKYWLTDHICRKETDGIRLFCQLHKWRKWNNRLLMPQVVWCWGEKKIFQAKLWLLSWWFKIGMFFSFEKIFLFQYYRRKTRKGEL